MKKTILMVMLGLVLTAVSANSRSTQWSAEKAREWYSSQEWPVGCCYVPSYAINQFEMWQDETYNPQIIDRELQLCQDLGFNTVRLFLHEKLWFADAKGFKRKIDEVLGLCEKHGIRVTFSFCTNGGEERELGPQPDARPGVHGGGHWCCTPSTEMMNDPSQWPKFKAYLQDILKTFGKDKRVLYWCLQNEPENVKPNRDPIEWMKALYEWAWEVRPSQPITSPVWQRPGIGGAATKLDAVAWVVSNSDIISFHCYSAPKELDTFIKMLSRFHRPMVCQEYMARHFSSTFEGCMPIFKRENVGCLSWGLVEGKCNFHYPWGHKLEDGEPDLWFHDIYYEDYTPWRESEIIFIKSQTADKTTAGIKAKYPITQ